MSNYLIKTICIEGKISLHLNSEFKEILEKNFSKELSIIKEQGNIFIKKIQDDISDQTNIDNYNDIEIFSIIDLDYTSSIFFHVNINKEIYNPDDELTSVCILSEEFFGSCYKINEYINEMIKSKNVDAILNIKAINTLDCYTIIEVSTDLSRDIFKKHFLSKYYYENNKNTYTADEFRPGLKSLLYEISDYSNYLINLITNKKEITRIKSPIILEIKVDKNSKVKVDLNDEFKKILEKYLGIELLNYFYSEINILIDDIIDETTYIVENIENRGWNNDESN